MQGKIILITGGAKSGKTSLAMKMAKGSVVYLATGEPRDSEMKRRINMHKKSRLKTGKQLKSQ